MSAASRPQVAAPVARPAPPRAPQMVRIKLEVTPPGARVMLDGVITSNNPLVLPSSDTQHRIRVEAKSYEAAEERFVADRSRTLRVTLARVKKPIDKPTPNPRVKKTQKVKRYRFDDL
jgi:multisubunit Na+/H+ antiporter MnhE subunit